jgi:hypothetical protein
MRWLALLLSLLLSACTASPVREPAPPTPAPPIPPPAASPAPARPVEITLREESNDRWVAIYRFREPVRGFAFERSANKFRAKNWTIAADKVAPNDQATWAVVADHEAIVAAAPFRELVLTFETDSEEKVADYLLHARFSEGSRLLYTGHFAGRALTCPGQAGCAAGDLVLAPSSLAAADLAWRFETAADRNIQLLSERRAGKFGGARSAGGEPSPPNTLDWTPTDGDPSLGTYAYFGNIAPRETPYGTMILDPGLPKWMLDSAESSIPKMLAWFEAETKTKLSFSPLLLVSAPDVASRGRSSKGGVLGRVAQIAIWGEGWQLESETARRAWLKFFAHELFHFWNGGMFLARAENQAWLHEGSSEYFAYRVLRALDVFDDRAVAEKLAEDANHCLLSLRGPLIRDLSKARPEYSCGAVAWAIADGVARAHDQTAAAMLGGVFSKSTDGRYDSADVVAALRVLEPQSSTVDTLERLLFEGLPKTDADLVLEEALRRAGVDVVRVSPVKAKAKDLSLTMTLGAELARCDCGSRVSVTGKDDGLFFHDVPECSKLKDVRVVAYEKHGIPKDSGLALEALLKRKDGKRITVTTEADGKRVPITLSCGAKYEPLGLTQLLAPR